MAIMEKAFENVGLILCDPKHEHRRTSRTAVVAEGSRSIKDVSELEVIRDITEKLVPDLTVIDLDMPDGSSGDFVRGDRIGNLGVNPFIPIIAVTWDPTWMLLRKPLTQVSMTYLSTNFRKGNTWANRRLNYQSNAACRNQRLYWSRSSEAGPFRGFFRRYTAFPCPEYATE